ncbi:MAG: GtrA family protein [Proteobacteria bacterium]|nr:GtrA family protein [Pseudomonadota bacterium]
MAQGVPKQFLRFCAVGAAGFFVDAAVLYMVAPVVGWYAGRVVSFWAAATTTWVFNRTFTFRAHAEIAQPGSAKRGLLREYLSYLASMLGGAVVNYGAYLLTLHFVPGSAAPLIGVAVGSCAGLVVNFLVARHIVFAARREGDR